MQDWFFNAGIIGFLRIMEQAGQQVVKGENYIEIQTQSLAKFHEYYFNYFFEKYNIAEKVNEKLDRFLDKMQMLLQDEEKQNEKAQIERIKQEKKYIKLNLKTQMDKIKKIDTTIYEEMLLEYNRIDTIKKKEEIEQLEKSIHCLKEKMEIDVINKRLTMNFFKSILSNDYFGQPSFLNVVKSSLNFEEQEAVMYKDYISGIVEADYLEGIMCNQYTIQEIKDHMEQMLEKDSISNEVRKVYTNIDKLIQKEKTVEQLQQYIKERVYSRCTMCEQEHGLTSQYSEGNFVPLAISSDNMKNFFWEQNAKFPICDLCKLILFCIPVGISSVIKIVKEVSNGTIEYREKEVYCFVNYDTSIEQLYRTNYTLGSVSKVDKGIYNPFEKIILNIVGQEKQLSQWKLNNIFVVEFEAEYLAYSRTEYFNIKKYVAQFFIEYATKSINAIKDYKYRLQLVDCILKNKEMNSVIHDRIREVMQKENQTGYECFLAAKTRMLLNQLKKGGENMKDTIENNNKKLYVLYSMGVQIHERLKQDGELNKLGSYTYKMLNSIKAGNKREFMDIVIRLNMSLGRDVSSIFLEVMQEENGLDFESIGHSFIAGLISNKYEKEEKGE